MSSDPTGRRAAPRARGYVARELDKGKYADAVTKLGDFQKLLGQLAAADKPKLDPATAATLSAEAQGVIDCINAIETA